MQLRGLFKAWLAALPGDRIPESFQNLHQSYGTETKEGNHDEQLARNPRNKWLLFRPREGRASSKLAGGASCHSEGKSNRFRMQMVRVVFRSETSDSQVWFFRCLSLRSLARARVTRNPQPGSCGGWGHGRAGQMNAPCGQRSRHETWSALTSDPMKRRSSRGATTAGNHKEAR
jgi:hypothetical protein